MTTKIKVGNNTRQFINQAWARDGKVVLTGQALILGLLMHTKSNDRAGSDMKIILALMDDLNIEE